MKCMVCGSENDEKANFCTYCGNKLEKSCNCWVKKGSYDCGKDSCPGYEPVSYTHLDVYKRQGHCHRHENILPYIFLYVPL